MKDALKPFWSGCEAVMFAEKNAVGPFSCLVASNPRTMRHHVAIGQYREGAWMFQFIGGAHDAPLN